MKALETKIENETIFMGFGQLELRIVIWTLDLYTVKLSHYHSAMESCGRYVQYRSRLTRLDDLNRVALTVFKISSKIFFSILVHRKTSSPPKFGTGDTEYLYFLSNIEKLSRNKGFSSLGSPYPNSNRSKTVIHGSSQQLNQSDLKCYVQQEQRDCHCHHKQSFLEIVNF